MEPQGFFGAVSTVILALTVIVRGINDLLKAGKDLCRTLGNRCPLLKVRSRRKRH